MTLLNCYTQLSLFNKFYPSYSTAAVGMETLDMILDDEFLQTNDETITQLMIKQNCVKLYILIMGHVRQCKYYPGPGHYKSSSLIVLLHPKITNI